MSPFSKQWSELSFCQDGDCPTLGVGPTQLSGVEMQKLVANHSHPGRVNSVIGWLAAPVGHICLAGA